MGVEYVALVLLSHQMKTPVRIPHGGFLYKRRNGFRELLFHFFLAGPRCNFLPGGHVAVAAVGLE
jgi:hypothetical protein